MPRPKTDRIATNLRLPAKLHLQIKSAAAENNRSLNAEIAHRLESSLNSYRR